MAKKMMVCFLATAFLAMFGCATTQLTNRTCRFNSRDTAVDHFGVEENVYEREVVEQYWQKKNWTNFPVSERKDLMSDVEDMAEDQYRSFVWVAYYRCMDRKGFVPVKNKNRYGPRVWRAKGSLSELDRLVKVPEETNYECLIDRECNKGFFCDMDRHVCSQDENSVAVVTSGCTKDIDCKGDRICEEGTCVSPVSLAPAPEAEEPSETPSLELPQSP